MADCLEVSQGSESSIPFVLTVDSHGLYSTVMTLHEGADYRLRPTVSRLRDSYEVGKVTTMQMTPGKENIAEALTKRNLDTYEKLSSVMQFGTLE